MTSTRIWTPARIIALLVIAVVIAGLARQAFAHPVRWVAVPSHAHAGQLTLKPCTYPTEAGDLRADCGTLVVPENRADPKSRLIAVPVTRIRSRSAHPSEPIFRLEGGPGRTNMDFPFASRYIDHHDLVLVGYRGVDGSAQLDCPEVTDARRHTADLLSARALSASTKALRNCADRLSGSGFDLAGYTIPQRVDDLDDARRALGYRRVDLLSESFGTRVALVYAWRHPQSIHRSVMIGANPPGHFVWQPSQTDAQLRRFATLCRCQDSVGAHLPKRWGPFPIHRGNVETASFFGLMESSSAAAPISAPMTLDAWHAAGQGDASGLWFQSLASALLFPRIQVWGDSAAMGRVDAAAVAAHFRSARSGVADAGNRFVWAGGALADAWPAAPDEARYAQMRDSDVPTLVVSGTLDGTTPAENATRELLPHLANGHQVLLDGFGHSTDFWNNQIPAGTHLINRYLDTGDVDASRFVAQQVDFTPSTRQTTLAKEIAGAMVGLALLTLVSLAWMARRVRRQGRLSRKTRLVVRSAWALVLGLGGWFAVALAALIVLPSVPLDAVLLIVPSMAAPVAMAGYLAWRDRSRVAGKLAGLVAAASGALIGAGVGYLCATGMLAVATTLVGAVAGTNLALIGCDIGAEILRRRRDAEVAVPERREPALQSA